MIYNRIELDNIYSFQQSIILFNELYITPSPGTNDWPYSAMTLYYFSQFGNMIDYNSITYNLQPSDIQWYNWRISTRNGIIIP